MSYLVCPEHILTKTVALLTFSLIITQVQAFIELVTELFGINVLLHYMYSY